MENVLFLLAAVLVSAAIALIISLLIMEDNCDE